jgi:hypothetical protein
MVHPSGGLFILSVSQSILLSASPPILPTFPHNSIGGGRCSNPANPGDPVSSGICVRTSECESLGGKGVEGWCPGFGTGTACCVKMGCFPKDEGKRGNATRIGSACTWKEECGSSYGGRIVNELAGGKLEFFNSHLCY